MADTIPDLWPTAALQSAIQSPIAILRTQASLLSQKTQGILRADVNVLTSDKGQVILNFDIVVPALSNYRQRLLSVQHAKDEIYPAAIFSRGLIETETIHSYNVLGFSNSSKHIDKIVQEKTAYSESDFTTIIAEALNARETIALLQSLIARSNEETSGSRSENGANDNVVEDEDEE